MEEFIKKPFMDRINDTLYLLKHSFTVIQKDSDIIKPTIHMIIYTFILTTLFFLCLLSFFSGRFLTLGVLLFLFTIFIVLPLKFFFNMRQRADQSWIVYNTITGKDISYQDAHAHTATQKSNIRILAFIDLLVNIAKTQKKEGNGVGKIIVNLFLAALVEVWDLLSNYMIPAVVIEQKPLMELVSKLKELKKNVPAALVGVFGIDFVGNIVGMILGLFYIVILAFSVAIGYLVLPSIPTTAVTFSGLTFSWVPVLIGLYIAVVIGESLARFVESIKVIYFTIFYTSITQPTKIIPSIKKDVTSYLQMK